MRGMMFCCFGDVPSPFPPLQLDFTFCERIAEADVGVRLIAEGYSSLQSLYLNYCNQITPDLSEQRGCSEHRGYRGYEG